MAENCGNIIAYLYGDMTKSSRTSILFGIEVLQEYRNKNIAKNNIDNPYTIKSHNLLALAQKSNIGLTDEQVQKLKIITQFNISARYEDYKNEFYNLCTEEYTKEQISNIEEVRTWLKELLAEK